MGRGEVFTAVWWSYLTERDHLENEGVDGRTLLQRSFKKWNVGMDWFDLVQGMNMWPVLMSVVTNLTEILD
jgi:hypothetical protein